MSDFGKLTKILEDFEKVQESKFSPTVNEGSSPEETTKISNQYYLPSCHVKHDQKFTVSENDASTLSELILEKVAPQIVTYHEPDNILAENFKILRSQVLHPRTGLPSRFILVTSSVPGEGKTYVATNLAFSFARTVPTLLIESYLRRPALKEILGISECPGLGDYLIGKVNIEKCIYKTNFPNLYLMPAGTLSLERKDYFSSTQIIAFLDVLKEKFLDFFFIFDSPSVLVASEAIFLSRLVDGILFVVRYGFSDREVVSEALDKIGKSKVIGLVFNAYVPHAFGLFSPKLKCFQYAYKYYKFNR